MSDTKPTELKVFISTRDSKCDECGEELGSKAWITLEPARGALCLACGDLDHLTFLPSGDAALTRRSKKHSSLSAIVKYEVAEQNAKENVARSWIRITSKHSDYAYESYFQTVLRNASNKSRNVRAANTAA